MLFGLAGPPVRYGPSNGSGRRSKNYVANTAAPWTSPWLPPGYEQNFWNAA